ncbi:RHS repeat-associated core domain-containing protein, partial [Streptomyces sp. NPDC005574]|uniref:RHS repeat-associated core domain-containing protein n=1 Tax=Streptomyces sp. NPDC005574 TaxID=3156891 RepID=UPI0033AEDF3B
LGLINFNGRVMDPAQSDFLTPDPIISNPLDGQDWNPYTYVRNSPLNYTDPTGYLMNADGTTSVCVHKGDAGCGSAGDGGSPGAGGGYPSSACGCGWGTNLGLTPYQTITSDTSGTTPQPAPKWDNTCPETNTGCHDTDGTATATNTTIQTSDTSETAGWQTTSTACQDDYCWDQYGNITTQPAGDLVADEIVIHADPNLLTEFGDWLTRGIGHTYGDEDHIGTGIKTIDAMCSDEECMPISDEITWGIVPGIPEIDGPVTQRSGQMPYKDRVPDVKIVEISKSPVHEQMNNMTKLYPEFTSVRSPVDPAQSTLSPSQLQAARDAISGSLNMGGEMGLRAAETVGSDFYKASQGNPGRLVKQIRRP